MNTDTKRHIDSARQVLVGVVPNPTSQIDQITNALIYKFMDDMDQASIKLGGNPSFFVGDLEKYAWTRLMDTRMGNQERMNLYGEALVKFSQAKQLPELFREIFKSAFLPYRSPETLGMFLKEIDYFDYSHPEELGNAYEYLLSIMSSQGDAGQFRTPRHIIDFIVNVVNPTKNDKVLDPACGTGGFLVSAYNHILEQHDCKNDPKKKEKPLTPDERKKLIQNFEGYDIDPTMVRISKVNMYLHKFTNPKIFQYDTLSSDERWNDKFDVILANPPFMSPKGGIKPHSKFSIQSSRSEVLFVDYIMNHLRPKGRAGIIVPEGIIFQSGIAHKQLRKNLIEDGLYAVISLPSGVFAPYSGVKTSILLFNNELAKTSQEILFVKIEQDGFDLGATKRPINQNDLPTALEILNKWNSGKKVENNLAIYVEKSKIGKDEDYNLSGDRYRVATDYTNAKWPMVKLGNVISTIIPPAKIQKELFKIKGCFPIIDQSQNEIAGWTNDESILVKSEKPLVIFGDHTCAVKYTETSFAQGSDGIKILITNNQLIPKYLYYILKTKPVEPEGYQRHFAKLKRYEIPLPPLEIQEQIVAELNGYQNIIAGAKKITESWKPKIEIDPKWRKIKLPDISENNDHKRKPVTKSDRSSGKYPYYGASGIVDYVENYIFDGNYLLISEDGANLLARNTPIAFSISGKNWVNNHAHILMFKNIETQKFVETYINQINISEFVTGMAQPKLNQQSLNAIAIPLPSLEIQKQIVEKIEAERTLVESAKKLIELYEQKTKDVIAKLWTK
jgi:type I restriction enzyme M protein